MLTRTHLGFVDNCVCGIKYFHEHTLYCFESRFLAIAFFKGGNRRMYNLKVQVGWNLWNDPRVDPATGKIIEEDEENGS